MKEIEKISADLFNKIRSRFQSINLGDEKAQATTDPERARFFNFIYGDRNNQQFGKITMSLIDEKNLKVAFSNNITKKMNTQQRRDWHDFLRNIRLFAKRNLLQCDIRDINKDNLDIRDIKQQSKNCLLYTSPSPRD